MVYAYAKVALFDDKTKSYFIKTLRGFDNHAIFRPRMELTDGLVLIYGFMKIVT